MNLVQCLLLLLRVLNSIHVSSSAKYFILHPKLIILLNVFLYILLFIQGVRKLPDRTSPGYINQATLLNSSINNYWRTFSLAQKFSR